LVLKIVLTRFMPYKRFRSTVVFPVKAPDEGLQSGDFIDHAILGTHIVVFNPGAWLLKGV